MFCPNCGANLSPAAQFCVNCGAPIPQTDAAPAAPQLPMNWYKFLINFLLWASGAISIISGIVNLFSGSLYIEAGILLKAFSLVSIGLGVFAIYTRFRLAGYFKNGPQMLLRLYIISAIANYVFLILSFINVYVEGQQVLSIFSVIINLVMIGVNNAYFQKRECLFTK